MRFAFQVLKDKLHDFGQIFQTALHPSYMAVWGKCNGKQFSSFIQQGLAFSVQHSVLNSAEDIRRHEQYLNIKTDVKFKPAGTNTIC